MCGIFLCKTINVDSGSQTLEGLKKLEYRGYDSWGMFIEGVDGEEKHIKNVGAVSESSLTPCDSHFSFGQTRWATHGGVTDTNCHPHVSNDGRFVLVHNGIFENYLEYKKHLQKNGYGFYSETDTEVLVNMIEFLSKNNRSLEEVVAEFFKKVKGGNAFVIYNKQTKELVIAKNGSPLHVGKGDKGLCVSSDRGVLFEQGQSVYSLLDGEVLNLNILKKVKWDKVKFKKEEDSKSVYEHHTLKEIFDQKTTMKLAYANNKTLYQALGINWSKSKNVFASGCGTAYNAAQIFSNLATEKGINARSFPANEMESVVKLFDKKTVMFLFSQSGETADTVILAKRVKENGGKVYSILNTTHSTLSDLSDKVFYIYSGKEIAVASTKAFTGMILTSLKLLDFKINKKDLSQVSEYISSDLVNSIKRVAKLYVKTKNMFVIGKGILNIIALESALKIKETSYIHAEGFASGELKHGVLALIEKGVPTLLLNTSKQFENDLENAGTQVRARGGEVVGVGAENKEFYDHFIKTPENSRLHFLFSVVVSQILAYELAVFRGLNPDKPRNLAKSVTVK